MLRIDAPEEEIAELGSALGRLSEEEMAGLFDPGGARPVLEVGDGGVADRLVRFGLAVGEGRRLRGAHRIRRRGARRYVMELGDRPEYVQDVWPETDALLAIVDGAPAGTTLDVGTGCGIVAIEAAARGDRVVATDLYETALELARFNAALNGLAGAIDFRCGHLFEPVVGERFDRVLVAPHYTRVAAQLRLEVLRDGPARIAQGGMLALATALEWEGEGPIAVVPTLLDGIAAAGARVRVAPIAAAVKREWFTVAGGEAPAGVVSMHRFLITVEEARPAAVEVVRPRREEVVERAYVPLARLARGAAGATAVVASGEDAARIDAILAGLAAGELVLEGPLPGGLLDACRWGAKRCVEGGRGAAGALVDEAGGVRPCAHGLPMANVMDPMRTVEQRWAELAKEAEQRRGCRECSAAGVCSRCLFPAVVDEKVYCERMRERAAGVARVGRLIETLGVIGRAGRLDGGARIRMDPALRGAEEGELAALVVRWRERDAWLVATGEERRIVVERGGKLAGELLGVEAGMAAELVAVGAAEEEILRELGPRKRLGRAIASLRAALG